MISRQILFIAALYFISGCSSPITPPEDIKQIINQSNNKKELEATISHYSRSPKDSLRLQATYFIIRNMVGFKTLNLNTKDNDIYFDALNKVWEKEHKKLNFYVASNAIDSVNKVRNLEPSDSPTYFISDLDVLSSDFLIDNIDNAFRAWEDNTWSKSISFADFCEYILPYRCTNTYPKNNIRDYFTTKYKGLQDSVKGSNNSFDAANFIIKDIDTWFIEDGPFFKRYPYLRPISFSNLLKGKIGTCIDINSIRVAALRSIGIPAVIDQIPNWGSSNGSHFWYKVIDPAHDTVKSLITNLNLPINTKHIISASSFDIRPTTPLGLIPPSVKRHYMRTVPKVYRQCFSRQTNSLSALKADEDKIPPFFTNDRLKDVTHEYLKTADVNLNLKKPVSYQKYAYLCVFDNEKWTPVAWARVQNGQVAFKNMGKNVLYLPAYYNENDEERIVPAGNPFILNDNGTIEELNPKGKNETVNLYTKFPYRIMIEYWQGYMVGCRFQFANKPDLSDSTTVHTITNLPFYQTYVPINEKNKFRYLYCQYKGLQKVAISELEFLGKDANGKEIKLTGKLIGNSGFYPNSAEKIMDGNRETYFNDKQDSTTYIGIDLGEGKAEKVTGIRFLAKCDDNGIVPNINFELFYWHNKWVSLGNTKGDKDKKAVFKNVSKNTLFLLKNTEGGTENRPFTYANGSQLFW